MLFYPDSIPSYAQVLLTLSAVTIGGFAALLYTFQCSLIYPANFPPGSREIVAKPSEFDMDFEEVIMTTPDKVRIRAYICRLKESEWMARNSPTILYLHANAGNMGHRLHIASKFYNEFGCNVVLLSYRGYGLSEGSPTEKGIRIDAETMLNFIVNDDILKNTKLIAYGQSLGGAIAIDLVSRHEDKFSGLILENTFLSIPSLIPYVLPTLKYFTFLCSEVWASERTITKILQIPILFLSGRRDEIVPYEHMRELHRLTRTNGTREWHEFENGRHNDTVQQEGYFEFIEKFLNRETRRGGNPAWKFAPSKSDLRNRTTSM